MIPKKSKFTKELLPLTYHWLNDIVIKTLTNTPDFSKEEQQQWFNKIKNSDTYKIWSIYIDEIPIGVFGIKNITEHKGEYWGYIGEKDYWGKGIGGWMIDEIESYARKNNLKKIYLKVLKSNTRAINLYNRKGFIEVKTLGKLIEMEKILA